MIGEGCGRPRPCMAMLHDAMSRAVRQRTCTADGGNIVPSVQRVSVRCSGVQARPPFLALLLPPPHAGNGSRTRVPTSATFRT